MSGIVGVFLRNGKPVERRLVQQMIASVSHRGPDGTGLWCQGSVGLGHVLLQTSPESEQARLPVTSRNGALVLTADARLDNRAELTHALARGSPQESHCTDSQLILAAYEKWGLDCAARLLGDFAFVVWDANERRLVCVRDHMGVKPLYYYVGPHVFAFASEMRALWCLPEVPRQVNEVRIAEYLAVLESEDKQATFYRDIQRLPNAQHLSVSSDKCQCQTYWALDPERQIRLPSNEAYAEHFHELFTQAVRCRLSPSAPVGSVLSGGLDSSAVTCVARASIQTHGGPPLHTLSAFFDGEQDTDERPFIDALLAQPGSIIPHRIDGNRQHLTIEDLEQLLWHQEEPFWYGFLLVLWPLYRIARDQGVQVLLDGTDGDSTLADCRRAYLPELARTGRWQTLAVEIDALARWSEPSPGSYLRHLASQTKQHVFVPLVRQPLRQTWRRWRKQGKWYNPIASDLAQRVDLLERWWRQGGGVHGPTRTAREAHYRRIVHSLFPFHLETLNKAASAFGLEYRHPFFDKRLVEFCLALPAEQKFYRGQTRVVMRRALASLLPEAVSQRTGKGAVAHHYLRPVLTAGSKPLSAVILNEVEDLAAYVDMPALREAHQRYFSFDQWHESPKIWHTAALALWLRNATRSQNVPDVPDVPHAIHPNAIRL